MQLSQMQDIGGCRAVVSNIGKLNQLLRLYEDRGLRHELRPKPRDYIVQPKPDGYRSVHKMYRFHGEGKSEPWNRLRIEVQLRTRLQHAWATAVETADVITNQRLKFGDGNPTWKRFFQLMGSVHAIAEKTPLVPGTPTTETELRNEIKGIEQTLDVRGLFSSFRILTSNIIPQDKGHPYEWYLLEIMPEISGVRVESFKRKDFAIATERYSEAEQKIQGTRNQVVLVSATSVSELKKAYPSYFWDTIAFTRSLEKFLA